jgi:methionyl-tRNA formyltransferase
MKVCYFGSGNFSKIVLENILKSGGNFSIDLVVTKSDKEKGRGKNLLPTPVKELALLHGIDVCDREDIKSPDFADFLAQKKFDIFVVCDYGKIIPKSVFSIPPLGSLGVHPSLLPKYRGPSPIHAAILSGDKKTGTTLFFLNENMDAGDIVLQKEIDISEDDDYISLSEKLAILSSQCVIEFLSSPNSFVPKPQDHSSATFTKMVTKEDGRIDWQNNALNISRKVRAYIAWPKAWCTFRGKNIKVLKVKAQNIHISGKPGEVIKIDNEGIHVITGDGIIILVELHPENSKVMSARDFVNGYRVKVGDVFE